MIWCFVYLWLIYNNSTKSMAYIYCFNTSDGVHSAQWNDTSISQCRKVADITGYNVTM